MTKLQGELNRLRKENETLRMAVLNCAGDNLCWVVDPEKAKALPEADFLESCRRYRAQIASERGAFSAGRTIAQLEARIVELERRLEQLEASDDARGLSGKLIR